MKISGTFYFVRDLDIDMHYLPSQFNTHCMKSKYSNKTNFEALFFLYGSSVKNIVHFYILRDFDIGMHYLPEFDKHCNSNGKNCGAPFLFLAAQFETIVHFYFLRDLDVGMHYLPEFDTHCNSNGRNLWSTIFYFQPHSLKMLVIFTLCVP